MKKFLLTPDTYAYNGSNADPADLESVRQHWAPGTLNKLEESKMKITKRQLRRIIKEEKARILSEQADEFSRTRDNLLGLIELMDDPVERKFVINDLIDNLMSLKDL